MRSYTVRAFDAAALELTLDFVVHGDDRARRAVGGAARPGDELLFIGPGGGYAPGPGRRAAPARRRPAALPAIAVALEALPAGRDRSRRPRGARARGRARAAAPDGVEVRWVHQGDGPPGVRLVEAVRALPWPDDDVHAFVHGEAGAVKELRRYLRVDRGLGLDRLSISGYWRLGVDDEGWRASKREWNAAIEQEEAGRSPPRENPARCAHAGPGAPIMTR